MIKMKKIALLMILVLCLTIMPADADNATILPTYGDISVFSDPSGAAVDVDGKNIGTTPVNGYKLLSGDHTLSVSKSGYEPDTRSFTLGDGEEKGFNIKLEPIPTTPPTTLPTTIPTTPPTTPPTTMPTTPPTTPAPGIGWYQVSCNVDGATVYFDGQYKGATAGGQLTVPYTIGTSPYQTATVTKDGYTSSTQNLPGAPAAGQTVTIYITLQAVPSPGTLTVTTNPSGANLYVDQVFQGTTPVTQSRASGTYNIQLTKGGFQTITDTVVVNSGQTSTASYSLQPKTEYGALSVTSNPSGASVYIDGSYRGKTGITVRDLAVGNHDVRLSLSGYQDWTTVAYVSAGTASNVNAALSMAPSANNGYISVSSVPVAADVYLNGKLMGTTQQKGSGYSLTISASPGTNTVSVEKIGYIDYETSVTVSPGSTVYVNAELTPYINPLKGSVYVSSDPTGANVFLFNQYKGITPLTVTDVPSGNQQFLLKATGYQDKEADVTVPAGGTATLSVSMVPVSQPRASPGMWTALALLVVVIPIAAILRRQKK